MTNSTHAVCQIWQDYKIARQEAKLGQIRAHSDKWWPLDHHRTRLCFTWWGKVEETLLQQWKSYDSLHFDKTSFFKHGSWAKSGDAMQNSFKVQLWENSQRHISIYQASNWTEQWQCGTHGEWGKLPGYFVIYNSGRLKKQIIILFLEGSSSRPALLFVPKTHSIISRHIQLCE